MKSIKALALASTLTKIPSALDSKEELILLNNFQDLSLERQNSNEKFKLSNSVIKNNPGLIFDSLDEGNIFVSVESKSCFSDCLCLLSQAFGFSNQEDLAYKNKYNFWYLYDIKKNERLSLAKTIKSGKEERYKIKENVIFSSLVEDLNNKEYVYFSRGSFNNIIDHCQLYWNGDKLEPIKDEIIHKLNSIIYQWTSSSMICNAFSYRPQKRNF